jgi:hypothetical protein
MLKQNGPSGTHIHLSLKTFPKHENPNVQIDRHGYASNDHILGQFLIDPTWVLEYIKNRETNELASQIIVDFTDQEASLDILLLESFWSDTLFFPISKQG